MNADQCKEFRNMCEHHYWGSLEIHKKLILDNIDGVIRSFEEFKEPKPKIEIMPWTVNDILPTLWIRKIGEVDCFHPVIIQEKGLIFCNAVFASYETLKNKYEYSTDLKTWKPCYKIVNG